MAGAHQPRHFLLVTYPVQGLINPTINLANRLAEISAAQITISTSISAHRKMFPNLTSADQEFSDGGPISYFPFSDGCDDGFRDGVDDLSHFLSQFNTLGSENLSSIIDELGSRGRRVDCIIYTFLQPWAADVARKHGIPSAEYWVQAATVFKIYHETFHGHEDLISTRRKDPLSTVELPGLPPLHIRDLPSFLTALNPSKDASYPFFNLWVVRKDCRAEGGVEFEELEADANAMIVEWCSQVGVLTHPSVGCFVTHCGWNSTLESLVFGVPTVGVPQMFDQATNAMLVERVWGTGVRVEVNDDGVVEGEELRRCLDLVMGEGERGTTIRRKVEVWKEKVVEAAGDGGSSNRNLRAFVDEIATS